MLLPFFRNFTPRIMRQIPTITKNLLIINVICYLAYVVLGGRGIDLNDIFGLHYFQATEFHLYQAVTSASSLTSANLPSLSGISYFGGYTEGYATYVEFLSYDYAKKAAKELTGNDSASLYYDYLYYNRRICLNLYSILDIMIHYDNATPADIRPYLYKIGITQEEDIQTIYHYIVMEPGTYITYFGGYLKILECRNLAMDCWGDQYSNQAFHKLLLELGPLDFESLKKEIRQSGY